MFARRLRSSPFVTATVREGISTTFSETSGGITATGLLGALAAYNGLIGNVTFGHADIGRLAATRSSLAKEGRGGILWISLLPYSFFAYVVFGLLGLVFWAATRGISDPGKYFVQIMGVAGFLLIILTQLRINLINAYSGSLSLANFFSRLHIAPGRSFWAVLMVVIGTAMMFANILNNLGPVLTFEGVFLAAWMGVIFADLVIVRGRFEMGPDQGRWIEYRRAMLPHWNWTGVVPLVVATVVGLILAFGGNAGLFGGAIALDLSSWITFALALLLMMGFGLHARGRSYQRRTIIPWPREELVVECPHDKEVVSSSDLFPCPFHKQWICANDCMATRDCGEQCTRLSTEELIQAAPLPPTTPGLEEVNRRLRQREAQPARPVKSTPRPARPDRA